MNFTKLYFGPVGVEAIQNIGDLIGVEPDEFCPLELRDAALGIERTAYNDVAPAQLSRHIKRATALPMAITRHDRLLEDGAREAIDIALKDLTFREREVIKLRFGIDHDCSYSLEEVAKIFKVTRERVRQIEAKGIRKLQKQNTAKNVEPYMDGPSFRGA